LAQQTQYFTKSFTKDNGIYGYVEVSTRPFSWGMLFVQLDRVVVEGYRTSIGNFSGSQLSNYNINFPFECGNCFIDVTGTASMKIRDSYSRDSGDFKTRVFSVDKSNPTVGFSNEVKSRHDAARKKYNDANYFVTNGSVDYMNVYNVLGADLGRITEAARNYALDEEKREKYNSLLFEAKSESDLNRRIKLLKQAQNYTKDTYETDSLITNAENELEQIKQNELKAHHDTNENTEEFDDEFSSYSSSKSEDSSTNLKQSDLASNYANKAQFYRDQAAKINPKYHYELDEKNRLLAEAKKYDRLYQEELTNTQYLAGSNENNSTDDTEENQQNYDSTSAASYNPAVDMSASKTTAAGAAIATSAILASEASRSGIGLNYGFGEIEYIGAEGMFLFSENFGLRVGYGQTLDGDTEALEFEDGYRLDAGVIYDFSNNMDGFGIGADLYYEDYQKRYDDIVGDPVFQNGNNLYAGVSLYLGIIKFSYAQQISGENFIEGSLQEEYDSFGFASAGIFFFF